MNALVDLWRIKGLVLKDPTIALTVPVSIENPAIAYNLGSDRFKVDVEAITAGIFPVNLSQVLGAALAHDNPVISRLTDGSDFIDPRAIRALAKATDEAYAVIRTNAGVALDPRDRNWALLWTTDSVLAKSNDPNGFFAMVYGNIAQPLKQSGNSPYPLWVMSCYGNPAVEIDPRSIRALTASDLITAYGSLDKLQQRTTTKELLVQIQHQGVEKDPTQIRALTSSDQISALHNQTATAQQINLTFTGSGNQTVRTPATGKAIRLKFLSLQLSADVDLGYRFGAAGTIYYLRTTAGPYLSNLIGCNNQGAADEILALNASAACTVKGYCMVDEV
jgi:hypothetical protein